MSIDMAVPADAAVDRILEWWSGGRPGGNRVNLVGGSKAGRARVLDEVGRRMSGAGLLLDAAGKSPNDLLSEVMDVLEVPPAERNRRDYHFALERLGSGRVALLRNAQQAGPTRRSSQVSLVLQRLVTSLTMNGVPVVVETDEPVPVKVRHVLLRLEEDGATERAGGELPRRSVRSPSRSPVGRRWRSGRRSRRPRGCPPPASPPCGPSPKSMRHSSL